MKEKIKTLQILTDENLENSRNLSAEQVIQYLEDFRRMHSAEDADEKLKLISLKISPTLLRAFRTKCELTGIPYQTKIKKIMEDWVKS